MRKCGRDLLCELENTTNKRGHCCQAFVLRQENQGLEKESKS